LQGKNNSLSKGLIILKEFMLSKEPLRASFLCKKFNIDKSTMSRILQSLIGENFIEYKNDSKEMILSDLQRTIIEKEDRKKIVLKTSALLDEIFYLSGECAYIGILERDSVLYLNQVDKSKRLIKTKESIGLHAPLHTNAFGKILLAFLSLDILNLKLKKYTPSTITSHKKLAQELELVKKRAYAFGMQEHEFGLCSLAIPYFNSRKEFIGAVGISGLSIRLSEAVLHQLAKKMLSLRR